MNIVPGDTFVCLMSHHHVTGAAIYEGDKATIIHVEQKPCKGTFNQDEYRRVSAIVSSNGTAVLYKTYALQFTQPKNGGCWWKRVIHAKHKIK